MTGRFVTAFMLNAMQPNGILGQQLRSGKSYTQMRADMDMIDYALQQFEETMMSQVDDRCKAFLNEIFVDVMPPNVDGASVPVSTVDRKAHNAAKDARRYEKIASEYIRYLVNIPGLRMPTRIENAQPSVWWSDVIERVTAYKVGEKAPHVLNVLCKRGVFSKGKRHVEGRKRTVYWVNTAFFPGST